MAPSRASRADKWMLALLVPLWLCAYALHLSEVAGDGLRELPVLIQSAPTPEARWEIASRRLDLDLGAADLQVGDHVLTVGGRDVRQAARFEIQALAISQADADGRVELEILRDGKKLRVPVQLSGPPEPWARAPGLFVFVVTGVIVLLRAADRGLARRFFLTTMAVATLLTPFPGGATAQALAHYWTWSGVGGLALGLAIDVMRRFPQELPPALRFSRGWAVLVAVAWYLPRFVPMAHRGLGQVAVHVVDAGLIILMCTILARNYRRSNLIGRRRLRWLLFGFSVALVPLSFVAVAAVVPSLSGMIPLVQTLSGPALGLIPFCFLIAIVRYNFFDIDRLLSQAAYAAVAVAILVAGLVLLMPGLASLLSSWSGATTDVARVAASVSIAGLVTAGGWWLQPSLDRLLFPDRGALVQGVESLSESLAGCQTFGDVASLLGERLPLLLGSERGVVYARTHDGFAAIAGAAAGEAERLGADEGWLAKLERRRSVLTLVPPVTLERSDVLVEADRERLVALGFAGLVPLRGEEALAAFVALGPKRSGDVYTATDLALLALIGDRASAQLGRFDDAAMLREGRRLADELSREKEAALRASSEKTHFLAAASHDLRQPVHAMGLLVAALADRVSAPEHAALEPLVEKIASATRSVDEMIHGLLDLSRLDAGVLEPELGEIALGPLLEGLVRELDPVASAKGIGLRCVPTSMWVRSDPLLLRRMLQNLLGNAVRYTELGRVLIGARRTSAGVRIEIYDTGPGFTPQQQAKMFDEYQRFAPRQQPAATAVGAPASQTGLGLGLAIVRRFAELLGHPLAARAEPGRGACFTLELPRVAKAEPVAIAAHARSAFPGLRVLVIDDDVSVRAGMRAFLDAMGCEVSCAASTAQALEELQRARLQPQLILADYWLGEGDTGLAAIEAIEAALGTAVPALLVSADSDLGEGLASTRAELTVLRKPVAPMRLRAAIAHVLAGAPVAPLTALGASPRN